MQATLNTDLLSKDKVKASLKKIINDITNHNPINPKYTPSNSTNSALTIAALGSGALYWLSSSQAATRYAMFFGTWFAILPKLGGAATNSLFNIESYLSLPNSLLNKKPDHIQTLSPTEYKNTKIISAVIQGIVTTIPLWYLGLQNGGILCTIGMISTLTSLLNLPIYIDSANTMNNWVGEKNLFTRSLQCGSHLFSSSTNDIEKQQTLRLKKKIMLALQQCASYFTSLNKESRITFINQISGDIENPTSWEKTFSIIIAEGKDNPSIERNNPILKAGLNTLYILLQITGMWQNFGFTVEAYNAGVKFTESQWTGGALAAINLITSLGFTVKGFETLRGTFDQIISGEKSIESIECPNMYAGLSAICILFAFFSGFGSDQAGYDGLKIFTSNPTARAISGIAANVGAADAYNLPQCLLLAKRCTEAYIKKYCDNDIKQHKQFVDNLNELSNLFNRMDDNTFMLAWSVMKNDLGPILLGPAAVGKQNQDENEEQGEKIEIVIEH